MKPLTKRQLAILLAALHTAQEEFMVPLLHYMPQIKLLKNKKDRRPVTDKEFLDLIEKINP